MERLNETHPNIAPLQPVENPRTFLDILNSKIQAIVGRIFYFLRQPIRAIKQLNPENVLKIRRNALNNKVHAFTLMNFTGGCVIRSEGGTFDHLKSNMDIEGKPLDPYENLKDAVNAQMSGKKFCSFNLATTHKVLGLIRESHNVSVLYDFEKEFLYVIDGKGDSRNLHFEDASKKEQNATVEDFINFLKKELSIEKNRIAYCEEALQRTNDCVIFPEKIMKDLVNLTEENQESESAQENLNRVLQEAKDDPKTFYAEINKLRDQTLSSHH